MGLFQNRPEEPSEWAGLPAEPAEALNQAELLAKAVPTDAVSLITGAGLDSLSVSVRVPAQVPREDTDVTPETRTP